MLIKLSHPPFPLPTPINAGCCKRYIIPTPSPSTPLFILGQLTIIASSVAALRREGRDCSTNASPRRPEWGKAKQKAERTFRSPKEGESGRETQRSEKSGPAKLLVQTSSSRAADKCIVSDSDWNELHLEAENENMVNSGSYGIPLPPGCSSNLQGFVNTVLIYKPYYSYYCASGDDVAN